MEEYIRLPSKKNKIYLDQEANPPQVIKVFRDEEAFLRELAFYLLLDKVDHAPPIKSPRLLSSSPVDRVIRLSYIDGETLLSALESAEAAADLPTAMELLSRLLGWLTDFDQALRNQLTASNLLELGINQYGIDNSQVLSLGDLNFRNFIIKDGEVYGLDFEQVELTDSLALTATLLAYLLTYHPIASDFKIALLEQLTTHLVQEHAFEHDLLLAEVAEQIQIINARRAAR